MEHLNHSLRFPNQRVSSSEKQKEEWFANCIDFVISAGLSMNDRADTEAKLEILHGNIPNEFYKKTLNPYNSDNEKYKRFPATMRNLDIMNDIVRRYVSEYFKGIHEFIVGADSPQVVLNKDAKLKQKVYELAQQAFQQEFEKQYQAQVQQATANGQNPKDINPADNMPDMEAFIEDFNKKYIDDESKQAQEVLNYIRSMTDDFLIYQTAFFNFVALGECYSYCDVRGKNIVKECVPTIEAYPIPNNNFFVEDHDMFARKMMLTYQQIMDMFDDTLDKKDKEFLQTYYGRASANGGTTLLNYTQYFEHSPGGCDKFSDSERDFFKKQPVSISSVNGDLYEVWHVVWRGEAKRGIVTFVNENGLADTKIVDDTYKLNKQAGDIDVEWAYESQVYEGYRIGHRYTAVYPIKARPVAFNRNGKLPYNGIMEVLPNMGKFSIIANITPYQIMRNIFAYHREMVIAKNKLMLLIMPESLVASNTEDRVYKAAADGILYIDDSEDANSLKAQQIRMLSADMSNYIKQLTDLLEMTKQEARELVDMNMQRYGDIAQSAGVGTTQEAITRSSMGMVILVQMFDEFRKRDYNRDLDYAKLAYIDGLDTTYWNMMNDKRFISLDVESFVNSDYSTTVRNEAKEIDKLEQLKQWAFSAAQNGDLEMAIAAITGDNVSQIKAIVSEYAEIKRQHEEQMQQMEQQLKQEEIENKIREIEAQGEQDRLTEELKYQYELQLKYIDVDVSMIANSVDPNAASIASKEGIEKTKANIAQQKLMLDKQKLQADVYNRAMDRDVKREQIASQERIAKTNKNKYDK